jgi:predicted permease
VQGFVLQLDQIVSLFTSNVLPILVIVAAGCLVQWRLRFDITTLNRLNMYIFVPALLFWCLTDPELSVDAFGKAAAVCAGHQVALLIAGWGLSRLTRGDRETSAAVGLGAMSGNSGNYGIPLVELAFGRAGLAYQAIVLAVSNITCYTLGIGAVSAGKSSLGGAVKSLLKLPMPYVLALALFLRHQGLVAPEPVQTAVTYLKDGLIPVALVTLGAQLVNVKGTGQPGPVFLASLLRLIASPALMYGLICLSGLEGMAAQVLFVGAAVPTAVNTVVLAVEFDNRPSLAAHIVLVTTLISAVTVSIALHLGRTIL